MVAGWDPNRSHLENIGATTKPEGWSLLGPETFMAVSIVNTVYG